MSSATDALLLAAEWVLESSRQNTGPPATRLRWVTPAAIGALAQAVAAVKSEQLQGPPERP